MKYRPEIDGLRALAVSPVILFHAGLTGVPGGYVGVDIFFVISGFLITMLLLAALDKPGSQVGEIIFTFYARRMRRILPALLVVASSSLKCNF